MPANSRTVSLGGNRRRYYSGVHVRACPAKFGKPHARSTNRFRLSTLLQIVPRVPGGIDGVGDYALTIAKRLRDKFGCDTVFATFKTSSTENAAGFEVLSLDRLLDNVFRKYDHTLLHYVNYGFQKRGVPFRLLSILRALRRQHHGRLLTIFHELYASGPPWTSAFWLQPVQIHLAKSVARLSNACIVSSVNFRSEVTRMVPNAHVELHPVPSGLEEPSLSPNQIADRDPHRWAIFGGTAVVERSLRSFRQLLLRIPDSIAPRKLFVLGGDDNPVARSLLVKLAVESDYRPRIAAADASEILKTCSFGWFNYFHRPDVETSVILKSSAFASACAHGVIPVFPHRGSAISLDGDRLPGPFFMEPDCGEIPDAQSRAKIAADIYSWYQRQASSESLVQGIAETLSLSAVR